MLNKKHRTAYIINKVTDNKYQVCKVLNNYNSLDEANQDLLKLLTKKTTENKLLESFDNKEL